MQFKIEVNVDVEDTILLAAKLAEVIESEEVIKLTIEEAAKRWIELMIEVMIDNVHIEAAKK